MLDASGVQPVRLGAAAGGRALRRRRRRDPRRQARPVAAPHRHDRRDAARARRRGRRQRAEPVARGARTGPRRRPPDRARPVQRRAVPGRWPRPPAASVTVRDWPRATTQAGDVLRDLLARMGCTRRPRRRRAHGHRSRPDRGARRRPARRRRAHPGARRPVRARRRPVAPPRDRAHPRPRDRPAGRAGHRAARPRCRRDRARRRAGAPAGARCTAACSAPTPTTGWRTPRRCSARPSTASRSTTSTATGKTFPDFPGVWAALLASDERPLRRERPRALRAPAPPYPPAHQGAPDVRRRRRRASSPPSTAAASRCWSTASSVWAVKARPLGRKGVVVGDRVRVVGDVSGDDGALARIVEVQERTTVLRRTADDDDPVERVIVANADQLVVVTALADPEPRPRLIDRALVAAFVSGMKPLLCLTKADLADPETLLLDLPVPRRAVGGHAARGRPDRAAGAAARPHQRADRAQRRRQVDAGQRPDPGRPPRRRRGQRRHRPRAAHLDLGADAGPAAVRAEPAAGSSTPRGSGRSGSRTCGPRT